MSYLLWWSIAVGGTLTLTDTAAYLKKPTQGLKGRFLEQQVYGEPNGNCIASYIVT